MSEPKSIQMATKINRLKFQQAFLVVLENGHQFWAKNAVDQDIEAIHLEIADTIRRAREQYSRLLSLYQQRT